MASTGHQSRGWIDGDEEIVYQRCRSCEHVWYFRRTFCPKCGFQEPETRISSGRGSVYARTVVHRAPSESLRSHAPYLIVMVDADEGFRLMAHGDPGLVIGDRVRARFIDFDGGLIPRFEKADQ